MSEFIYAEWLTAKRKLADELQLNQVQRTILGDWFRRHMFELGVDFVIDERTLSHATAIDIEELEKHKTARMLTEKLIETKLFMREETPAPWKGKNIRTRILVFGAPGITG